MTTLAERKLALEKELAELEVLEKAAALREKTADKEKRIESLLLSLVDQPLFCKMPVSSIAHVKTIFNRDICSPSCFFYETCQSIIALTGKTSTPAQNTGKKASPVQNTNNIKVNVSRDRAMINISFNDETVIIPASNWVNYKKNLTAIFPRKTALKRGLSQGQYSGLMHEKSMSKHFK